MLNLENNANDLEILEKNNDIKAENINFGDYSIVMEKNDFTPPKEFIKESDPEEMVEIKNVLLGGLDYIDFEITGRDGHEVIGAEFEKVREDIEKALYDNGPDPLNIKESRLIREALKKNHLSISRINYLNFLINNLAESDRAQKEKKAYDEIKPDTIPPPRKKKESAKSNKKK